MTTARYDWQWHRFDDWPRALMYDALRLRSEIFVVEQNCVFLDMDGLDRHCEHLHVLDQGQLCAYLRRVPPGIQSPRPALGRVVVARSHRGSGLGRELMRAGIRRCESRHPQQAIQVAAQQHLEPFYGSLGFSRIGEPYDEDGILHVEMLRPGDATSNSKKRKTIR